MCLYPTLRKNRKYVANKKNKGVIPPLPLWNGKPDMRVLYVPTGCEKCIECMKQKARGWQVRLLEEIRHDKKGHFITLTFSDEGYKELYDIAKENFDGYELDNEIATIATRRFLERWRKEFKKSVKHWFITELGQKNLEHIHIHGIIWTKESVS